MDQVSSLVAEYEKFLVNRFTLSSTFSQIASGRLNQSGRTVLVICLITLCAYVIQFLSHIVLHFVQPENAFLKILSKSMCDVLGEVSIMYEIALLLGMMLGIVYRIILLKQEAENKLHFVTDLRSFQLLHQRNEDSLKQLNDASKEKFTNILKYSVTAMRLIHPCAILQFVAFHLFMCTLSVIYSESVAQSVWYFVTCIILVICFETNLYAVFTIHIMTVVSSEYLIQRLRDLVENQEKYLQKERNISMRSLMEDYDDIANIIARHNETVKHVLLYSFVILLPLFSFIFTFNAFDFDPRLKFMVMTLGASFCLTMFFLLSNAGRVSSHARSPLNHFFSMQVRKGVTLANKRRLLITIHRITQQVHPIGFTCGQQVLFTRGTVIRLLMESISYTFMILNEFFYARSNR